MSHCVVARGDWLSASASDDGQRFWGSLQPECVHWAGKLRRTTKRVAAFFFSTKDARLGVPRTAPRAGSQLQMVGVGVPIFISGSVFAATYRLTGILLPEHVAD